MAEAPARRSLNCGLRSACSATWIPTLTSSRRQTLSRYGGGFQVCRPVGSRFFTGDSSPAPRRDCPPLLFDPFRPVAVSVDDQAALRAAIDPRRKRDTVPVAAARAIL